MIIKNIYPAFVTDNPHKTLEALEKAGFKVIHINEGVLEKDNTEYVVEDNNKNRMDVVHSLSIKNNRQLLRVNVDNFDEAIDQLKKVGFNLTIGPDIKDNYKCAYLKAPSDFAILLYEHIK